jgi:hypothetical protein
MRHLLAFVTLLILLVLFIIITGVMAFSITIVASATASTAILVKGGAFGLSHLGDHSLAIIVQHMQRPLEILGISIVSCGKLILKIHFEISMLYSTLSQESIRDVPLLGIVSHKFIPPLQGTQKTWYTILEPHSPRVPCAVGLRRLLN